MSRATFLHFCFSILNYHTRSVWLISYVIDSLNLWLGEREESRTLLGVYPAISFWKLPRICCTLVVSYLLQHWSVTYLSMAGLKMGIYFFIYVQWRGQSSNELKYDQALICLNHFYKRIYVLPTNNWSRSLKVERESRMQINSEFKMVASQMETFGRIAAKLLKLERSILEIRIYWRLEKIRESNQEWNQVCWNC